MAHHSAGLHSVIKEGGTEHIKNTVREFISAQRKERRAVELNKNRVALGEIPEDSLFTPDFVAAKAKALTKKTLSIEEYHQLQNALIQNEENVGAFLQVANAITALVRDMSCTKPDLQISAANCCCNLALGNAKACTTLAKGISAYLLIVLEGCNRPMMEVALWTIGNMVTGCKVAFDILHAQDALKHIVSLLKECDAIILPAVTYAAVHYLYTGYHWIKAEEKQKLIKAVVHRKLDCSDINTLWLIALLSSIEDSVPFLYDIVPVIIDLLYEDVHSNSQSITKVTAYIRIIGNSVAEPSGRIAHMLLDNPKFPKEDLCILLNKLLYHQHLHIRRETLWLIGNLYAHNQLIVHSRISDILPHLSHIDLAISSLI